MTRDVVSVQPATPVGEIVRMLLERDFRALPVVDVDNRLIGIITNGDLVERAGLTARVELLRALEGRALERELAASGARERTAADVMTASPLHASADQPLETAAHLMAERRIKRLPVVDQGGHLAGMLSRVDVLRTMGEDYPVPATDNVPAPTRPVQIVGDIMRDDVPSVPPDAPLGEVLDAITSTRLNRAIVVDRDRKVLGIISDQDLLARLDPGGETGLMGALMRRGWLEAPSIKTTVARDVMQASVLAVAADMPVGEAAQRMLEARHKVLPITDADGRLRGVVDRADLLRALPR
jgi:CBS domain-containing protein